MNVQDVKSPNLLITNEEMAKIISKRQSELEDSYWKIENRLYRTITPITRYGQVLIKDFLWRITEEVGEALEAKDMQQSPDKVHEELADALHFVQGLCCVTKKENVFITVFSEPKPYLSQTHHSAIYAYVRDAGILGNTLKLKPWKQTDILTDLPEFEVRLSLMINSFLQICWSLGMDHAKLYDFYWRKSEVNLFRIRSNY